MLCSTYAVATLVALFFDKKAKIWCRRNFRLLISNLSSKTLFEEQLPERNDIFLFFDHAVQMNAIENLKFALETLKCLNSFVQDYPKMENQANRIFALIFC